MADTIATETATKTTDIKSTSTEEKPNVGGIATAVGNLGGWCAGFWWANKKGSGFWGYVGYGLLGSIGGSMAGAIVDKVIKK